jgi:hypothetical protein
MVDFKKKLKELKEMRATMEADIARQKSDIEQYIRPSGQNREDAMNDMQKKSILALAAAAAALASATQALAASFETTETPAEPAATPAPAKKKTPAAAPAAPAATETPAAAAPVAKPAPAAAPAGEDLATQCRKAAKAYAEVYGREGLKEVLTKFTDGTLADVAPEKLPELLKALS